MPIRRLFASVRTARTVATRPAAAICLAAAWLAASCASLPEFQAAELDQQALAMIRAGFREQGIAKLDRLTQDLGQSACSSEQPPSEDVARRIQEEALKSVVPPTGGRYLGDFREGERLAQNGRGMTWTDASAAPSANGGQCYNCHELDRKEISFGTIGPSLWNYGKQRGVKDPADPLSQPIIQYTWAKLWNSKSYSACSHMPRFGHAKLLNEEQLRHLMALLLDPRSPVNQ